VEKKHHETGEQPNGHRRHVEPEPKRAVRSRPHQGTHAERSGFELRRSVLIRARARRRVVDRARNVLYTIYNVAPVVRLCACIVNRNDKTTMPLSRVTSPTERGRSLQTFERNVSRWRDNNNVNVVLDDCMLNMWGTCLRTRSKRFGTKSIRVSIRYQKCN